MEKNLPNLTPYQAKFIMRRRNPKKLTIREFSDNIGITEEAGYKRLKDDRQYVSQNTAQEIQRQVGELQFNQLIKAYNHNHKDKIQ